VPDKPLRDAGGSVRGLGATSSEEGTSHPRYGTARRPAYRKRRAARGLQALSDPWTDDTGEVMIWVATEYRTAEREGRSAVGVPWSTERLRLTSSRPVDPLSRVSLRWAAGSSRVYIGR
jgi:hypothetical protein